MAAREVVVARAGGSPRARSPTCHDQLVDAVLELASGVDVRAARDDPTATRELTELIQLVVADERDRGFLRLPALRSL